MIIPLRLTEGCLFIDNSSLSLINECFRKGAYGLGLAKKQARDETALRFGGIMHKILEERYRQGTVITQKIEADMVRVAQAEFMEWSPEDPTDFRNLDRAIECLQRYNQHYPAEGFKILEVNGHQGTETPFAIPLGELEVNMTLWVQDVHDEEPVKRYIDWLPIVFTGRIDLVIEQLNGVWLMDHKTTSIGGGNFFSPFYTDMQFQGYAWAVQQMLDMDRPPAGVKLNGLVNRRPTRTGTHIEFLRDDIPIHHSMVADWKQSFLDSVELHVKCHAIQRFPRNTSACVSKYGKCEFYDVCSLPYQQREIMLASGNYVDRTWNPIEQEEDKPNTVYMP